MGAARDLAFRSAVGLPRLITVVWSSRIQDPRGAPLQLFLPIPPKLTSPPVNRPFIFRSLV